jgi:uncharacterized protein YPO0396
MKIPHIPFINPRKETPSSQKRRGINTNPDQRRIQRELDYDKRIDKPNGRLKRLQDRVKAQKRRSYGS